MNEENNLQEVEVNTSNLETRKKENKKNKWKVIIVGVLVVIAIAVGLFIGWNKLNSNPVSIYKNAINDIYRVLNEGINKTSKREMQIDLEKEAFLLKLDANLNSSRKELKNFTGLKYSFNLGMDYPNQNVWLEAGISDKEAQIIKALVDFFNGNCYLKSEEILNKTIKLGEFDLFEEVNIGDIFNSDNVSFDKDNLDYILKSVKNILIDSLDKTKFKMSNEVLNIKDKDYNLKKVTYELTKENLERTIKFALERMLDDDKLVEKLAQLSGYTEREFRDALNEIIESETLDIEENITIDLYVDSLNRIIAGSIKVEDEEIVKFDHADDLLTLKFGDDEVKIVIQEEKEYIEISGYQGEEQILLFKIMKDDKDFKSEYSLNIDGVKLEGNINLTNLKENKNSFSGEFLFSVEASILGEKFDLTLDGTYSIEKNIEHTVDTLNSVDINDLSEEDLLNMYSKLENVLKRFGLSDLLSL